jgi:hypothetical protein
MANFLVLLVAYFTATNIIEAHPMNNSTDTNSTTTPDRPEPTNPTTDMIIYVWSLSYLSFCGIFLMAHSIKNIYKKFTQNQIRATYEEIE